MTTTTDRIQDFLDEVGRQFDDLPEPERDDLLDDLRQHLIELAADDPDGLELELVDPQTYADELRRSAGLPDPAEAPAGPRARHDLHARLARRLDHLRQRPAVREVQDFLPSLRPAWWVVRGWVMVVAAAHLVSGGPWWRHVPVPDRSLVGLAMALVAIAVSVRLGRDDRDRTRTWRAVDVSARVVLVLGLVQALTSGMVAEYITITEAEEPWQPPVLRHPDGEPITNLYLFDDEGNPVEDVFVFDGVGRPVEIGELDEAGFGDIDTVYARRPDGTPLTNRFPLEQYVLEEPADGDVAEAYVPDREPRSTPEVAIPGDPTTAPSTRPTEDPGNATGSATPSDRDTGTRDASASPSPSST